MEKSTNRRWTLAGAGAALGLTAGLVLGGLGIATAATSSTSSTTAATAPALSPSSTVAPAMPAHGSAAHEDAETPVTGSAATEAQAAAVKSVGSGTAGALTADFTKDGFEVTVTKPDGTQVEVHLDSSFTVVQGGGHHSGVNDNDADDQAAA
jgi:hypothetical protein